MGIQSVVGGAGEEGLGPINREATRLARPRSLRA
jgi:hypothetical protein